PSPEPLWGHGDRDAGAAPAVSRPLVPGRIPFLTRGNFHSLRRLQPARPPGAARSSSPLLVAAKLGRTQRRYAPPRPNPCGNEWPRSPPIPGALLRPGSVVTCTVRRGRTLI